MDMIKISFDTDLNRKQLLDKLASELNCAPDLLINEAIDSFLDLYEWQTEYIKKGLAAADRGEFVPQEEVEKTFAELRAKCQKN